MNKEILVGLGISFVIFIVYLLSFFGLIFFTPIGMYIAFGVPAIPAFIHLEKFPFIFYVIILPILFSLPFFLINLFAILLIGNLGIKKGLKIGNIFILLTFLIAILMSVLGGTYEFAKSQALYEDANLKGNDLICFDIPIDIQKIECLKEIALTNNNLLICDKIDIAIKDVSSTETICNSLAGIETCYKNKDLLSEEKFSCYEEIAIKLNNLSYCDKIENYDYKSGCIGNIAANIKNPSICNREDLNDKSKTSCYIAALRASKNVDLYKLYCPKISDPYYQKECSDYINSTFNK